MTLLSNRMNSEIGNIGFEKKKAYYANSPFTLTKTLVQKDKWQIEEIEERQLYLAELAVKAWPNAIK